MYKMPKKTFHISKKDGRVKLCNIFYVEARNVLVPVVLLEIKFFYFSCRKLLNHFIRLIQLFIAYLLVVEKLS